MSESGRQEQAAKTATRLDSAHVPQDGQAAHSAALPVAESALPALMLVETTASAAAGTGALPEQVQKQAGELAERLQHRQSLLDSRESELNARAAAVETQLRSSDLRIAERQELIAAQLDQIARHRELLEQRLAELGEEPVSEFVLSGELEETIARARLANTAPCERATPTPTDPADIEANARGDCAAAADDKSDAELEQRHRDLDRRQAQLYQDIEDLTAKRAQINAQRDENESLRNELDAARATLDLERKQIEGESSDLKQKASDLDALRIELEGRASDNESRCRELDQREHQLAMRSKEIETALKRFKRLGVTQQRIQTLERQAEETDARSRYLDDAEAMFAQQQVDFDRDSLQLKRDRQEIERQQLREREAFEKEKNQHETEVGREKQELSRRSDALDSRDAALAQLQAELGATQKEVLEMRLAAEEVWARLAGSLAPAALSQSIAQVRAQLGDHYRLASAELKSRLDELRQASTQLVEQRTVLLEQKTELEVWAERRREEMERQAARLIAREQDLNRQHDYYEKRAGEWEAERAGYRREIQRLLTALRETDRAAA